jgi:hypothetical protein
MLGNYYMSSIYRKKEEYRKVTTYTKWGSAYPPFNIDGSSSQTFNKLAKRHIEIKSLSLSSDGQRPTPYFRGSATEFGSGRSYVSSRRRNRLTYSNTPTDVYKPSYLNGNPFLWRNFNAGSFHISFPHGDYVADIDNRLLEKIQNTTIDIGTILGESLETIRYVGYRGAQIARFGLSVVTGRWGSALKQIGISKRSFNKLRRQHIKRTGFDSGSFAAAALLEYNFAIKPLVNDVASIAEVYMDPDTVARRLRLVSSTSLPYKDSYSRSDAHSVTNHSISGVFRGKVVYRITNPEKVTQRAFGLHSASRVVWELIPFSWLVDYVVNIGDFINACTATQGLAFSHGTYSFKGTEKVTNLYSRSFPYNGSSSMNEAYKSQAIYQGYCRRVMSSFPRPSLKVVASDISAGQLSNVFALGTLLLTNYRKSSLRRIAN